MRVATALAILFVTVHVSAGVAVVEEMAPAGTLYVIAVGVDRVADAPRLVGAENDAAAVASLLQQRGGDALVKRLIGPAATRSAIQSAFDDVARQAKPEDTLIFFFAGMGIDAHGQGGKDLLLGAADSSMKQPESCITGTLLGSWIRMIQARHQLVLLDTCRSSAGFEAIRRAVTDDPAVAALTERDFVLLGTDMITYEVAGKKGTHGSITLVLLEGLSGAADVDNDRIVSAQELQAYYHYMLHKSSVAHGSYVHAISHTFGRDFGVLRVAQQEAAASSGGAGAPLIRILEPKSRGFDVEEPSPTVAIRGVVVADGNVAEVRVGEARAAVDAATGEFTHEIDLDVGVNSVEIVARDAKGRTARETLRITRPKPAAHRDGKDYALLFANNDYANWPQLTNPLLDANALKTLLETKYEFHVELVESTTHEQIIEKLEEYKGRKFGKDDQLLIFFAGHGQYSELFQDGFIVAKNSPAEITAKTRGEFVQMAGELTRIVNSIQSEHILLLLDTCFGGAVLDGPTATRAAKLTSPFFPVSDPYDDIDIDEQLLRLMGRTTRKAITSGGKTYVPDGAPGRHSPFCTRLLAALDRGADAIISSSDVYQALLASKTRPRRSDFVADCDGDFVFVSRALRAKARPKTQKVARALR